MIETPVFPTMFYEMNVDPQLAMDIVQYIKTREPEIRNISEATQPHPVSDYATDFSCPIEIPLFMQHVMPEIQKSAASIGYQFNLSNYWVSCYTGPAGSHPMHNHQEKYNGRIMMSAILYLANVGYTDFFSMSYSADRYQHSIRSELGKIVFFPSIVPHQYRAEQYDGNSRYTLPFNGEFVNAN